MKLFALWLLPLALLAQTASKGGPQNTFSVTVPSGTNLSNQPLILTVSVPAANGYDGFFRAATLTLPGSGLCVVTVERDGAAPSGGTALTITKENPGAMAAAARATHLQAFLGATTSGTVIARHQLLLGGPQTIKLGDWTPSGVFLGQWIANPTGSASTVVGGINRTGFAVRQQLTIRSCNVTGISTGTINWEERVP